MKANIRIKKAMSANEHKVLIFIKREMREEGAYRPSVLNGSSWRHALERLEEKGKIKYSKKLMGYVTPPFHGRKA